MPTGSTETGRWIATRIVPPCAADAPAEAPALAAEVAAGEPPAAVADGELVVPPHAAITALIEPIDRPTIAARWMNSRRLSRPAAKASITSSCSGAADRRTLSNLG